MNFRRRAALEQVSFQLAPMIDIVFLLLIFFIVTWNFARYERELEVNVPAAEEGKERRHMIGELIINVKADGAIVVNRRPLNRDELREILSAVVQDYPDQAVILRGDEKVAYQHIVEVLDICRSANIWNVAFATSRPLPGQP
jgi:biopolymer transport protein ExbD